MAKVLITGGAGFIGSNLAEELAKGNDVTILDDLSTGKIENIKDLIESDRVKFIRGSIADRALVQRVMQGIDYVFHQAAIPSVQRSIDDPLHSHEINTTGALNVLVAARDNEIKKLVFASSSSVYGDTPILPKCEDMNPSPLSPYAVNKLAVENYCRVFQGVYGLKTVCLRYFNVFGPKQDPSSRYSAAIPLFIRSLFSGEPLTIFGDGEQTRDFTFVKKVVQANIKAAESDASGVYNIANGKQTSLNFLIDLISKITGRPADKIYQDARPGDVKHSHADISRAETFGYRPEYDLEYGLKETVKWFS